MNPPSQGSPFTPPGSWNEEIHETVRPRTSWTEWLYGLAFSPPTEYTRYRFRPAIYAATNQDCGPGITLRVIYEFVQSLRALDFSKDDHSEEVGQQQMNSASADTTTRVLSRSLTTSFFVSRTMKSSGITATPILCGITPPLAVVTLCGHRMIGTHLTGAVCPMKFIASTNSGVHSKR